MSGRALHAVLRLLPGSLSQCPDNPLQVDRLPPDLSGVELDYPVQQDPPAARSRQTILWALVPALAAPLLTWCAQLIPVPLIHGGFYTIALMLAAGLIALGFFGRWSALGAIVVAMIVLPICAQLVRDVPYALVALIVAVMGTGLLADALIANYLWLKSAAPVSRARSLETRAAWQRRWRAIAQPLRGAEVYVLGYLLLLLAGWYFLRSLARTDTQGDFWRAFCDFLTVALMGLLWSVILEWLLPPLYGRRAYGVRARWGACRRALTEWCTYNRLNTQGVGVHQGPAGDCTARRYLLAGVVLAWSCLWAGAQNRDAGMSAFLDQLFGDLPKRAMLESLIASQYEEPTAETNTARGDEPPPLTAAEQDLVRQMHPLTAESYLKKREAAHLAARAEQRAQAQEADATGRPAGLLVDFSRHLARVAIDVIVPSLWTIVVAAGLVFGIASRTLAGAEVLFGVEPRQRILSSDNWEMLVERVRTSQDDIEQSSLLMGANARDDTPVLVPRSVFNEHAHVLGDSGSGKTSMGLLPLITQLMRSGDCSVVVVDLKADDQTVFECLRTESQKLTDNLQTGNSEYHEYPFRWFTTVMGRSSFVFNPLTQRVMSQLSPDQRTDVLTAALGLQYGNDYGRKYYGDANYDVLNYAMREYPDIQSLAELESILLGADRFPLPQKTKEAGSHVRSSIRRLARIKALNACATLQTPQSVLDQAIDLDQLFEQPQALYVALPTSAGIANTAEIARIFLYSLMEAAQHHARPRKQVYLVVDEFQRIVSKNVELFLQQARSMNIGCIFSNQSLADLESVDTDLLSAVRANTRLRQVFGAGNQTDIDDLLSTAGETVFVTRTWSFVQGLFAMILRGMSMSEHRGTRLTINDVLLATDAPGRNIFCVRRGAGYAQFGGMPFVMDAVHHISKIDHNEVLKATWPTADERMVVASIHDGAPAVPPGGPAILGGTGQQAAPPVIQAAAPQAPAETPEVPSPTSEFTSEGIHEDLITQMYEDRLREHQARQERKKRRRSRAPDQP